jgi:peroxiredoxin Q/BCP
VEIVGVSFDPPEKNRRFAENNGFPFRLLSDVDRKVGELFQTKRSPQERSPHQAKRRTYLIDPEGRIAKAYRVTDNRAHADEVLGDLDALQASAR